MKLSNIQRQFKMPENVLEKIIKKKIEKIEKSKKNISIGSLNELIEKNKNFINFKEKIVKNIKKTNFRLLLRSKKLVLLQE